MDTLTSTGSSSTNGRATNGKPTRGKDQLNWSDDVWQMIDQAVNEEILRSRMTAKFLPSVYVHKKRTTVDADIVVPPVDPTTDPALSVEETTTKRIQQFNAQSRLSRAQVEAEGEQDADLMAHIAAKPDVMSPSSSSAVTAATVVRRPHRASTAVSLALQAAKLHAQAEDLVLCTGACAVCYHPLFTTNVIQALDPNLLTNLDAGLLNILPSQSATNFTPVVPLATAALTAASAQANVVLLPASQIILVSPTLTAEETHSLPRFAENGLNGVAQAVSQLQKLGYNDNYAAAFHTVPFADFHEALKNTLIQPVEPMSHLVPLGIYGTGNLPPFPGSSAPSLTTGLPTHILNPAVGGGGELALSTPPIVTTASAAGMQVAPISSIPGFPTGATVLYTGFLVSLSGNSMDVVRGLMDDGLDVCMTFTQKNANESYLFNHSQRYTLRLKDQNAVTVILFLDK